MNEMDRLFVGFILLFILIISIPLMLYIPLWTDSGRVISLHYGTQGVFLFIGSTEYIVVLTNSHGRQSAVDPCQRTLINDTVTITQGLNGGIARVTGC